MKSLQWQEMHKISYDLPIGFYPRDFLFEKINKDCWIFYQSKYWLHLGESQLSGAKLPPLKILPHEVNILTSKKSKQTLFIFSKKKSLQ